MGPCDDQRNAFRRSSVTLRCSGVAPLLHAASAFFGVFTILIKLNKTNRKHELEGQEVSS
ncbi:hypothetical protein ACU8KH_05445 [Lachancea thermotolerans]